MFHLGLDRDFVSVSNLSVVLGSHSDTRIIEMLISVKYFALSIFFVIFANVFIWLNCGKVLHEWSLIALGIIGIPYVVTTLYTLYKRGVFHAYAEDS